MIFCYNKAHVGDVLMVIVADSTGHEVEVERRGSVARVFETQTNTTFAWNIFNVSTLLEDFSGNGQVFLSEEQIKRLNAELKNEGFGEELCADNSPKFVIGYVKELKAHEDSDHLNIAQVEVDNGEVLQIVAGAPNIEQGQFVVVAKPGAMMPDGSIIWPGELRGVASFGMLCSARELQLPNAPQVRGILVLDASKVKAGEVFDKNLHWHM